MPMTPSNLIRFITTIGVLFTSILLSGCAYQHYMRQEELRGSYLRDQLEREQANTNQLVGTSRSMEEKIARLDEEIKELNDDITKLNGDIAMHNKEIAKLKRKTNKVNNDVVQIQKRESEVKQLKDKVKEKEKAVESKRREVKKLYSKDTF